MSCGKKYTPDIDEMAVENYDPNGPVCNNQADFNMAFRKALVANNKQDVKNMGGWLYVYVTLWFIFLFWAIVIAMRVSAGRERTLHLVFAIVASPAYVLAHYVGLLGKNKMGCCGDNRR